LIGKVINLQLKI